MWVDSRILPPSIWTLVVVVHGMLGPGLLELFFWGAGVVHNKKKKKKRKNANGLVSCF
jgi:hypothetical protein